MTRTLAWVVGAGGVIGSHVGRALAGAGDRWELWNGAPRVPWSDRERAAATLADAARAFASEATGRRWTILWCAGIGTPRSRAEDLETEAVSWQALLASLDEVLGSVGAGPGTIFLASSAGAIHVDPGPGEAVDEDSPVTPATPYGRHKREQERQLEAWAAAGAGRGALVGRLSTIYGAGQNLEKGQGLVAQLSRAAVLRRPVQIWVPLDTLRDFLHAGDLAAWLLLWLDALEQEPPATVTKIFASEQPVSVAGVLQLFQRIVHRRPLVVVGRPAALPPPPARFRSRVRPELRPERLFGLAAGITQLHREQLRLHGAGRLAPAAPPS